MSSVRALALAVVAALVLSAGCSSSSPAAAPPRYQHRGPDPVGVTTLDLGSAGPVFGERLATVYYPADPSTLAGHPRFSYNEASTLPKSVQGILPAKYNTTTTVDAYTDAPAQEGALPDRALQPRLRGRAPLLLDLLTGIASWGYVVVSADYLERGLAAQVLGSKTKPTAAFDSSIMQSSLAATEHASVAAGPRSSTASPIPTGWPPSAIRPEAGRPSTHSTLRRWPPPSAGPRWRRWARRRTSRSC